MTEEDTTSRLNILLAAVGEARLAHQPGVLSGLAISQQLARMRSKILGVVHAETKLQRVDQGVLEMNMPQGSTTSHFVVI
jgi:hypothetical protein